MVEYIKANKHKGIVDEIPLNDLGHINIICGKNNSGKTSLLEAVSNNGAVTLGKKVTSSEFEWLFTSFSSQVKYTTPDPNHIKNCFATYLQNVIKNNVIWYTDQEDEIANDMSECLKKDIYLRNYSLQLPYKTAVLEPFFKNIKTSYKPIYAPPKRTIEEKVQIGMQKPFLPDGTGLTNKLFYLKNQDLKSNDYKIYRKIYEAFQKVTGYSFNIFINTGNSLILHYQDKNGQWITASNCGLGLSDVLVMISLILVFDYSFYCIEEPESHLHPEMQKRFLDFIRKQNSKQFLISTHSSIFLNPNIAAKIYYTNFDKQVSISDQTSKSSILYNLGYSVADNLVSDVIIFTEGPTDQPVIAKILEWIGLSIKYNIRYWFLGGDIMQYLDLSIFKESKNVFALIDSDPGSKVVRTRFSKNCEDNSIECHKLQRYALENYFTLEAIKECVSNIDITELKPYEKVDSQLNLQEGKTIKFNNANIIEQMSLQDIEGTDLLEFCMKVKQYCEENIPLTIEETE